MNQNIQMKNIVDDVLFPFNIHHYRIPQDFQYLPLHWHEEAEIIYVKKGKGRIMVTNQWSVVEEGTICTIGPKEIHSICQMPGCEMEYEEFAFSMSVIGGESADICAQKYILPLAAGKLMKPLILRPGDPGHEYTMKILQATERVCEEKKFGYELSVKAMMLQLFFVLVQDYPEPPAEKTANEERLKMVLLKLHGEYRNRLTVEEMADFVGCSSSHFMKWFKKMTGVSFGIYLNHMRLSEAAKKLKETDEKILSIAAGVGFDNLSNFNRQFKARFGVTPREYRNR